VLWDKRRIRGGASPCRWGKTALMTGGAVLWPTSSFSCLIPPVPFFDTSCQKNLFAFRQPFWSPHGVNRGPEPGRLQGLWRSFDELRVCRILAKGAKIRAYSPQEPKKRILRDFRVLTRVPRREKEPVKAYFPSGSESPISARFHVIAVVTSGSGCSMRHSPAAFRIWVLSWSAKLFWID